jgi:UPF0716 family protein affecting phage T7 exclusion
MQEMQRGVAWGGVALGLAIAAALWLAGLRAFVWLDRIRWLRRYQGLQAVHGVEAPARLTRFLAWAQRTSWAPSVLAVGLFISPGLFGRVLGIVLLVTASAAYGQWQAVRREHTRQRDTDARTPSDVPWV